MKISIGKIQTLTVLLILNPFFLVAQYSYILKGNVPKEFNNNWIILNVKDNIRRYIEKTDSTVIKNNDFFFSGIMDQPNKNITLLIKNKSKEIYTCELVLDSGFNKFKIEINDTLYHKLGLIKPFSVSNELNLKLDSLKLTFNRNYQLKNHIKGSFSLPLNESHQLNILLLNLIKSNSSNFFSLISLYKLSKYVSMTGYENLILDAYACLSEDLKKSALGISIYQSKFKSITATEGSKIGNKIPNFELTTLKGDKFNNKVLEGSPYIIAFSATWCLPCQKQLPKLIEMYNKYKEKGLKVVYFNIDDNLAAWKKYISLHQLTWINVSERTKGSKIADSFGVYGLPTYFVINKNGVIVYNSDQIDANIKNIEKYIRQAL